MIAAAAMSLSSVCVVCNALRLKTFKAYKENKQKKKENIVMNKEILIEGMMCGHCTGRVEGELNKLEGVSVVSIDTKKAVVALSSEVSDELLIETITNAGYKVTSIK